ncbi:TPA: fimbrial protein [Photobacterium damselae]|uniref:fimbrial protein n=1 Tax=Photobacterium damselae TaxID=38293 RepID=UPI002543E0DF
MNTVKKLIVISSIFFSGFILANDEKPIYFHGGVTNGTCDTQVIIDGESKDTIDLGVISINDFKHDTKITGSLGSIIPGPADIDYIEFSLAPVDGSNCPINSVYFSLTGLNEDKYPDVLQTNSEMHVGIEVLFNDGSSILNKPFQNTQNNFDATTREIKLKANFFATSSIVNAGLVKATAVYQTLYL